MNHLLQTFSFSFFFWMYVLVLSILLFFLGVEFLGSKQMCVYFYNKLPDLFSKWLDHSVFPPEYVRVSGCPHWVCLSFKFLTILVVGCFHFMVI